MTTCYNGDCTWQSILADVKKKPKTRPNLVRQKERFTRFTSLATDTFACCCKKAPYSGITSLRV